MPPVSYFHGILLVSFALSGRGITSTMALKYKDFFFICVPLCHSFLLTGKEKNKWLLLRAKLAATSTERIVESWDGSRDVFHFRTQICWLWVKGGENMSLVYVVNSDLNSVKTKQHQPLWRLFHDDYI